MVGHGIRAGFLALSLVVGLQGMIARADITPGEALGTNSNTSNFDSGGGLLRDETTAMQHVQGQGQSSAVKSVGGGTQGQINDLRVVDGNSLDPRFSARSLDRYGKYKSFLHTGDGSVVESTRRPGMIQSLLVLPLPEMIGLLTAGGSIAYLLRRVRA